MPPSTVITHGSAWSADLLYDGWGDDTPDETAGKLGDEVLAHFHRRAPDAYWAPSTAEVIASTDSDLDPDELDILRQTVTQEVWAEFVNEELVL